MIDSIPDSESQACIDADDASNECRGNNRRGLLWMILPVTVGIACCCLLSMLMIRRFSAKSGVHQGAGSAASRQMRENEIEKLAQLNRVIDARLTLELGNTAQAGDVGGAEDQTQMYHRGDEDQEPVGQAMPILGREGQNISFDMKSVDAKASAPVFRLRKKIQCISSSSHVGAAVPAADWVSCEMFCAENEDCGAWAWNSNKTCSFLRECDISKYNARFHSGVRVRIAPRRYVIYPAMKCDHSSLGKERTETEKECAKLCDRDLDCMAWTFRFHDSRCFWKKRCIKRQGTDENYISGVSVFYDPEGAKLAPLTCSPQPEPCSELEALTQGEAVCPRWGPHEGESSDPAPGTFTSPYQDILNGTRVFNTTFPERLDFPSCRFLPPQDPLPFDWADKCIVNMRNVGFLDEVKARPNPECPAGWFLCKGMCYTLVQRYSRGPEYHHQGEKNTTHGPSYYSHDYMGIEQRCGSCGGARVAFVGEDPKMQQVAAEAARQTINDDKATWVRRYRFLKEPSPHSEAGDNPYQPWHRYVTMFSEDPQRMTYQRFYTGEKDGISSPQYDVRFRNQEASILCVNTVDRISAATRTSSGMLTMDGGCEGEDRRDMWDNDKHRWFPEHNWPYPGL